MSRWFRFYDDALNDPKVQRLPGELFKAWVNLLCLASRSDGEIHSLSDAAFALRLSESRAAAIVAELAITGLLDSINGRYFAPHNWNGRQFKGDVSNERVKQHRERKRNVTQTVTVTPPDTDTDTDTESKKDSVANATAAVAAPVYTDSRHELWGEGVAILGQLGVSESAARSNIGRWLKMVNDDCALLLGSIQRARDNRVINPIPWITQALATTGPPGKGGKKGFLDLALELDRKDDDDGAGKHHPPKLSLSSPHG